MAAFCGQNDLRLSSAGDQRKHPPTELRHAKIPRVFSTGASLHPRPASPSQGCLLRMPGNARRFAFPADIEGIRRRRAGATSAPTIEAGACSQGDVASQSHNRLHGEVQIGGPSLASWLGPPYRPGRPALSGPCGMLSSRHPKPVPSYLQENDRCSSAFHPWPKIAKSAVFFPLLQICTNGARREAECSARRSRVLVQVRGAMLAREPQVIRRKRLKRAARPARFLFFTSTALRPYAKQSPSPSARGVMSRD